MVGEAPGRVQKQGPAPKPLHPSASAQLKILRDIALEIGIEYDAAQAVQDDETVLPTMLLKHGAHVVVAVDCVHYVRFIYMLELEADDQEKLAGLPDAQRREFSTSCAASFSTADPVSG